MKLHLPKLLFVAVVAAASFSYAVEHTTDSSGNKLYNVGQHTGSLKDPNEASNMWICSDEKGLTLAESDKLGFFVDGNLYTGAMTGQVKEEWKYGVTNQSSVGYITKNVKVEGTLTIQDTAQVVLGGQYKGLSDYYTGIIADSIKVAGGKNEEGKYITNLSTWNMSVGDLTVDSGIVSVHTNGNGNKGNSSISVDGPYKQVRIKNTLNVNGGSVTIGSNSSSADKNANDDHCQVGFGNGSIDTADYAKSTISQSWIYQGKGENATDDSVLNIEGKSVSVGGLNIEQHKGTMSISNGNYHIIADNGITYDSQIAQYADAKLTIGGILAENKYKEKVAEYSKFGDAEVHVNQYGSGEINLTNGIVFNYNSSEAKAEHSSFTQHGSGVINLSGVFGRTADKQTVISGGFFNKGGTITWAEVYFDIKQQGDEGVINLNSGAIMSAGDIEQTADAILNLKGTAQMSAQSVSQSAGCIVVDEDAKLQTSVINAGVLTYEKQIVDGKEVQVVTGGSVEMNGNVSLSDGSISTADKNVTIAGTLAADNITVDNSSTLTNDGFIVVSGGIVLKDGATLTNNGTITGSSTFALMTADEQAAVILSETEDLIILEEGAKLINEGSIEKDILVKGGTLTLADSEGSTQNITMESGTIYVTGQGVQTGSLTLNGGTINFADGATVALDENQTYDLSGAEIIVMVDDVNNIEGSTVTLFSGNGAGTVTGLESATFKFQDANAPENVVTGTITDLGSGSIKVEATVAIPEPTTATLSLLALAGLCARRRRR